MRLIGVLSRRRLAAGMVPDPSGSRSCRVLTVGTTLEMVNSQVLFIVELAKLGDVLRKTCGTLGDVLKKLNDLFCLHLFVAMSPKGFLRYGLHRGHCFGFWGDRLLRAESLPLDFC